MNSIFLPLFTTIVAFTSIAITQETEPKVEVELKEQDPLSIASGKLLAFSVSSEDQVAATPPGKWANVFGFTYFRYTERGSGKQKVSINGLVNKMAEGVIPHLGEESVEAIKNICRNQSEIEIKAIQNRNEISKLLFTWRENPGDEPRIQSLAKENGNLLADLLKERITVYAEVFSSISESQRTELAKLRKSESIDTKSRRIAAMAKSRDAKRELTLLFGKFVIWATNTPAMSEVIDAGRPAVFFGFADLRTTNRKGSRPSKSLRRDASRIMLRTMDNNQRRRLDDLVKDQATLMSTYMDVRGSIAKTLNPNSTETSKIDWAEIRKLCIESELAEARLGILQAERLGAIFKSLSDTQIAELREFVAKTNGDTAKQDGKRRQGSEKSNSVR